MYLGTSLCSSRSGLVQLTVARVARIQHNRAVHLAIHLLDGATCLLLRQRVAPRHAQGNGVFVRHAIWLACGTERRLQRGIPQLLDRVREELRHVLKAHAQPELELFQLLAHDLKRIKRRRRLAAARGGDGKDHLCPARLGRL